MTSLVTSTPAGTPSSVATSAGPCDSPAVSQRNTGPVSHEAAAGGADAGHANGPEGHCLPGAVRSLRRSERLRAVDHQAEVLTTAVREGRSLATALGVKRKDSGEIAALHSGESLTVPGGIHMPEAVLLVDPLE